MDHANRDQLYRSAVRALGQEEADTLMASLPPADWTDLARTSDLDARFLFTDTEMDRRFTETNTEMDRRFNEAEHRMELRFEKVDVQFEALEHKLTASFEATLRKQTQWMVGGLGAMAVSMLGVVISILTLG